jgi:hypothetical protein
MPYQYLPINQAKEGNIVERINTSSSSTKPYEQEGYLAIVGEDFTNYPGNRPALDETYWKLVKTLPGNLWTLASDQNGTTWAHTIGSTCEWEDEMPATIKEQPMLAITSFETRMKSKDLWYEFLENIVTDSSITSVAELTKMESHKYPAGAFDWSSSLQGQDFWWHIDQEWVKIRSKETQFFEPH